MMLFYFAYLIVDDFLYSEHNRVRQTTTMASSNRLVSLKSRRVPDAARI